MQHIDPATSTREIEGWVRPGMLPFQHSAAPWPTVAGERVV